MAVKDIYHEHVKNALEKDGWTITHDPLKLTWKKKRRVFIDLGAEKLLAAEKGTQKIAVEVKSFVGPSELDDLYNAVGQFVLYRTILEKSLPEFVLFLAIRIKKFQSLFADEIGEAFRVKEQINLLVFDEDSQEISQWVP